MTQRLVEDWIDGYLYYTSNSESPLTYKKWVAISAIASVLQRKCVLRWGTIDFYPNMYIVLVGPSGLRKGTAMGPGYHILNELGITLAAESTTREALVRELCKATDSVHMEDGTLSIHASLTIFSAELAVFLNQKNEQLMADLCDWYDCRDKWIYRTKHQGEDEITGVWVNMIGATTPSLIQTTLPRDAIGGGLTSRIVFVYADKIEKPVPFPFLTEAEKSMKTDLVLDLEKISMLRGEFKISDDFLKPWEAWYMEQTAERRFEQPALAGYNARRPTHILKLCMILNVARTDDMTLTNVDLTKALSTLAEVEPKMPRVFEGIGRGRHSDILSRLMTEIGIRGRSTFTELMKAFHNDIDDKHHFMKLLATCEAMKMCRIDTTAGEIYITHLKKGT